MLLFTFSSFINSFGFFSSLSSCSQQNSYFKWQGRISWKGPLWIQVSDFHHKIHIFLAFSRLNYVTALTLKDFADAKNVTGSRIKKSIHLPQNVIENEIEALPDDEDLEIKHKRRKPKVDPNHQYNDIGITTWFLVGEHIGPEDVKSFALICRSTEAVVRHASFWKCLYRRYQSSEHSLANPNRLRGLRSNVVKLLYRVYPPFIERLKKPTTTIDLESLKGLRLVSCYFKEKSNVWIYCYKFWNQIVTRKPRVISKDELLEEDYDVENVIAKFNNIFENPHEGFTMLLVFTSRFIPMPVDCIAAGSKEYKVLGIRQILSTDMRNSNLEIEFSRARENTPSVSIKYHSIIKFKILNWWHPDYNIF